MQWWAAEGTQHASRRSGPSDFRDLGQPRHDFLTVRSLPSLCLRAPASLSQQLGRYVNVDLRPVVRISVGAADHLSDWRTRERFVNEFAERQGTQGSRGDAGAAGVGRPDA
jgi:hypothetical protein